MLGSLFNAGYRDSITPATSQLPAEAAHRVEESAGAGFAVAGHLGPQGEPLAAAVRAAFTDGLGDAMRAGALIAIMAAVLVAWRGPRRERVMVHTDHRDTVAHTDERDTLAQGEPRVLVAIGTEHDHDR